VAEPLTPAELRRQREALRLSSDDLGRLMGVSGDYVVKVERGERPWTPAFELRAERALAAVRAGGGELPVRT